MSLCKLQIEHYEHFVSDVNAPKAGVRKWMKRQMNKFMRRKPIPEPEVIEGDDETNRSSFQVTTTKSRPFRGFEY